MNAYDFDAVVYGCDVYCNDCLPDSLTPDSEEVHPIFAIDEWDYYPTCDNCGREHNYITLTSYGQQQLYLSSEPKDLQKLRQENDGKLPSFAWPGGYPLIYATKSATILCPECATNNNDSDDPINKWWIHYEGEPEVCEECNVEIESAYGIFESGPEEGDYTSMDHIHWYQYGKLVLTTTPENCEKDLRNHMNQTQFWPNAWWISDHGNPVLMGL